MKTLIIIILLVLLLDLFRQWINPYSVKCDGGANG